jgi:hypothetical protein
LKNFQLVGFVDMGSAWSGFLPNADNTMVHYYYNSVSSSSSLNPIVLQLSVPNSNGLALGYGGGVRTTLLGYFVRLDMAWNIDGHVKPMAYFSLGTDF